MMENIIVHPLYSCLTNLSNIRLFMENHVFSVWTFMLLLQNLIDRLSPQKDLWTPPLSTSMTPSLKTLREIWIEEELDDTWDGIPQSHTTLYLRGMKEINASTYPIENIFTLVNDHDGLFYLTNSDSILESTKNYVLTHLAMLEKQTYSFQEVFVYFMYGRELLIPSMFSNIRNVLVENNVACPIFLYYLERHIEIDKHHGDALKKQSSAIQDSTMIERMREKAYSDRLSLWDGIYQSIHSQENPNCERECFV